MQTFLLLGLLGLALLLQSTALEFVRVAGMKPDLVMVLVVFHAILRGPREGAFLGLLGGLAEDVLSGFYLGMNGLSRAVAGYLVGLLSTRVYRESTVLVAGLTMLVSWGAEGLNYLLLLALGVSIPPEAALLNLIFPIGVYNGAVALLFYRGYQRLGLRGFFDRPGMN
ncbi:MAG: rod shape-determining protein MreD [Thermoanaerobacterales bacterium]|nr:rod shape-determining protein MreD [Bacillota bacterium]MDI6906465.1 rod shape-determining protein MreD [Thermoanaerobacterales bacterium]